MKSPLTLSLPLIEGETPSGYVARMARLHRTTPRDLSSDLGMRWPFLCSGHEGQLERLAWLTGHNSSTLKLWSATKLALGRYRVGHTHSSTSVFRRTALRFCPQCVLEARERFGDHGIYEMLEWKVLSLHRCERHGTMLRTLPPAGHSHEAYDFASQALRHWSYIEATASEGTVLPPTRYEGYVRDRIRKGEQDDWLRDLGLTALNGACLSLGTAIDGCRGKTANSFVEPEARRLAELGFSYLAGGSDGLSCALHLLHEKSISDRPYFSTDLGPFYDWLHKAQVDPTLRDILTKTRDHIFETYPVPLDKDVLGQTPPREIWLTIEEARRRSGFGAVFLKKLLGHLEGISADEAMKRTDIRVSELSRVLLFWSGLMNLSQAAKELSIRAEQVKALMRLGVLTQVQLTSALRYARREEIHTLLQRTESLPDAPDEDGFLPLRAFCCAKGIPLVRVVADLMSGALDGLLRRGKGTGVHAIEVSDQAFAAEDELRLNRDLTLAEAAKFLRISIISIRKLRDAGYLVAVNKLNPDTNHIKTYVTRESIAAFQVRYATLGQVASYRNVAPIHLARQLDREEVEPVSCNGDFVRVYEKQTVMDVGKSRADVTIEQFENGDGQ